MAVCRTTCFVWSLILGVGGVLLGTQAAELPPRPVPEGQQVLRDEVGDPLPAHAVARLGTTRLRTPHETVAVVYSPDGRLMACAGVQEGFRLFEAATGKQVVTSLDGVGAGPVAFSPDGKVVAAMRMQDKASRHLTLLDLATGKEGQLLLDRRVEALVFSPDGSLLAVGASNFLVLIDLKTRAVKHKLDIVHPVQAVAFSPDGKLLASAGGGFRNPASCSIHLWDTATGKAVGQLDGHKHNVHSLAFVCGGKTLASASLQEPVRLWDVARQRQTGTIETACECLVASPDGTRLATSQRLTVRFWEADGGKPAGQVEARVIHLGKGMAFSPDGKRLLTGGQTLGPKVWDVATAQEALSLPGHSYAVVSVAFSPDGKTLASRSDGRTVRLWDLPTRKELRQFRVTDGVQVRDPIGAPGAVAFSPDGRLLVSRGEPPTAPGGFDHSFFVWDAKSGEELAEVTLPPAHRPNALAFAPNGDLFASADDGVRRWSLAQKKEIGSLRSPSFKLTYSLAFAPGGCLLAVGGRTSAPQDARPSEGSRNLELWDWRTGELLRAWPAHPRRVVALAFSPGGDVLATCGGAAPSYASPPEKDDPDIKMWEPATGALIRVLKGHEGGVACVALSPDGRVLASAGYDRTVRLWDVFNGAELARFSGHAGPVLCVAFAPDGKTLASGSADTTILLWDVSQVAPKAPEPVGLFGMPRLWLDLGGGDAERAFQAVRTLAASGDRATAFLGQQLKPVPAADGARVRKLIADLGTDDFEKREAASAALLPLGPAFEPELRRALASDDVETRRRAGKLLDQAHDSPDGGSALRQKRAVLALEMIGSEDARAVLGRLAGGDEGATLTQDAWAALERLKNRP
jgi:WD40 repeat protein